MANKKITNIFDSALQMTIDTEQKFIAGDETCFTDNKILANVKTQVAAMVPEAELNISTSSYSWTQVFCFDVEYRLTYKNIYGHIQGFSVKVMYEKCTNESDKYTIGLTAPSDRCGWDGIALPNKAKAYTGKATNYRLHDKSLTFYDPSEELVKGFVNALVTPNRRKAIQQFINDAKKYAIESANTKNMLDIESIDVVPVLDQLARKACMGIPEIVDEPNCRKVVLLKGQYGCKLEVDMYKDYMQFSLTNGSDYNSDHFDTNFIRLLNGHFGQYNIDISTHVPYDKKELLFDMMKRICECYQKTRFLIGYDAWFGMDNMWKRNPDKE